MLLAIEKIEQLSTTLGPVIKIRLEELS